MTVFIIASFDEEESEELSTLLDVKEPLSLYSPHDIADFILEKLRKENS